MTCQTWPHSRSRRHIGAAMWSSPDHASSAQQNGTLPRPNDGPGQDQDPHVLLLRWRSPIRRPYATLAHRNAAEGNVAWCVVPSFVVRWSLVSPSFMPVLGSPPHRASPLRLSSSSSPPQVGPGGHQAPSANKQPTPRPQRHTRYRTRDPAVTAFPRPRDVERYQPLVACVARSPFACRKRQLVNRCLPYLNPTSANHRLFPHANTRGKERPGRRPNDMFPLHISRRARDCTRSRYFALRRKATTLPPPLSLPHHATGREKKSSLHSSCVVLRM